MVDPDTKKIANFSLVFEEEGRFQVENDLFNLSSVGTKDEAIVSVDNEDTVIWKKRHGSIVLCWKF